MGKITDTIKEGIAEIMGSARPSDEEMEARSKGMSHGKYWVAHMKNPDFYKELKAKEKAEDLKKNPPMRMIAMNKEGKLQSQYTTGEPGKYDWESSDNAAMRYITEQDEKAKGETENQKATRRAKNNEYIEMKKKKGENIL